MEVWLLVDISARNPVASAANVLPVESGPAATLMSKLVAWPVFPAGLFYFGLSRSEGNCNLRIEFLQLWSKQSLKKIVIFMVAPVILASVHLANAQQAEVGRPMRTEFMINQTAIQSE
jgi:hypothetical protein